MPRVIWLNHTKPADVDPDRWVLHVNATPITIDELRVQSSPVAAKPDCTGGWWSELVSDAVALADLVTESTGRSVDVESVTGFGRHFPIGDLADIYLAVGDGGQPVRRGHGAPVRLVVPGRRDPEWIKWVTSITTSDRPSWLQPLSR